MIIADRLTGTMIDVPDLPLPPPAQPGLDLHRDVRNLRLAGVPIDAIDFDTAVRTIVDHAESNGEPGYVVTPNAQHVVLHQGDPLLREIYERAYIVATDGVPLLWAARLLGRAIPGRVNGTDIFEALCGEASRRALRVYLLGGRPGAALAAASVLTERHPALEICGTYCPKFGFEWDPIEQANIVRDINASRPHLLFVGLGAPKQEYWMYNNRALLRVPMMLGVGGSFEFVGGLIPRAPRWMQRAGLEWFFRLLREPGRLWQRYLVGNTIFCTLIAREFIASRARRPQPVVAGEAGTGTG